MKVLLVDDEKKFVTMLAKRLALRGIDIDCAYTGEEALLKAEKVRYDVAILDVKMPGIGGIDLKHRLKGIAPFLKVIFLTGHGSRADFETGSAGATHYLAKPIQIEELITILHAVNGSEGPSS